MCIYAVLHMVLSYLIACHYECIIINININLFLLIELQGSGTRLSQPVYYFHKKKTLQTATHQNKGFVCYLFEFIN